MPIKLRFTAIFWKCPDFLSEMSGILNTRMPTYCNSAFLSSNILFLWLGIYWTFFSLKAFFTQMFSWLKIILSQNYFWTQFSLVSNFLTLYSVSYNFTMQPKYNNKNKPIFMEVDLIEIYWQQKAQKIFLEAFTSLPLIP